MGVTYKVTGKKADDRIRYDINVDGKILDKVLWISDDEALFKVYMKDYPSRKFRMRPYSIGSSGRGENSIVRQYLVIDMNEPTKELNIIGVISIDRKTNDDIFNSCFKKPYLVHKALECINNYLNWETSEETNIEIE